MEKLFYTISEVAELLGESTSCIRFWSNSFPKSIKPKRNAKGNRQFTARDIEAFKQIQLLLKKQGMTIKGAAKKLAHGEAADNTVVVLDHLKDIRGQLVEIKKGL